MSVFDGEMPIVSGEVAVAMHDAAHHSAVEPFVDGSHEQATENQRHDGRFRNLARNIGTRLSEMSGSDWEVVAGVGLAVGSVAGLAINEATIDNIDLQLGLCGSLAVGSSLWIHGMYRGL